MFRFYYFFLLIFFCCSTTTLFGQVNAVVVESIDIEGNRKTKKQTIFREMNFMVGDTISIAELSQRMEENRLLILNTGLFILVRMNIKNWDEKTNHIAVQIDLQENWFIYPFPIFELADRNFNVWWDEFNRSLKRVNYGVRFYHLNTTGRRDRLKLILQFGFTKKFELSYNLPMLGGSKKWGMTSELFYAQNKNIGYQTVDNRLLFASRNEEVLLQRFRSGLGVLYRPGLRHFHSAK